MNYKIAPKTINQYLDQLLELPAAKKTEEVIILIKNLHEHKVCGRAGGNDEPPPVLLPLLHKYLAL